MNPSVVLVMLALAFVAGGCLASAVWLHTLPRTTQRAYDRGKSAGHLEAATACVRRLDAEYRAGYANGGRDAQLLRTRPMLMAVSAN